MTRMSASSNGTASAQACSRSLSSQRPISLGRNITGIALGCSGATSGFGSQVGNENTLPHSEGRQIPSKAVTSLAGRVNHQFAGLPPSSFPGFGSAKLVKGTRQRHSGRDRVDFQSELDWLRADRC